MGLLQRLHRVIRAYFYRRATADPEQMLWARLDELEERLAEARAEVLVCAQQERRLASLVNEHTQQAERLLHAARNALLEQNEPLAREAVQRHLQARRQAAIYQELWHQQHTGLQGLQRLLQELEAKRAAFERDRQYLSTQRQLAHTRRLLVDSLYHDHHRAQLEQAEEAMLAETYTADAYEELSLDRVAEQADALAPAPTGDPLEQALRRLRDELGLPAPQPRPGDA